MKRMNFPGRRRTRRSLAIKRLEPGIKAEELAKRLDDAEAADAARKQAKKEGRLK